MLMIVDLMTSIIPSLAALLHLCNENTLKLEMVGDDFADFNISKD